MRIFALLYPEHDRAMITVYPPGVEFAEAKPVTLAEWASIKAVFTGVPTVIIEEM